MLKSVSHLLLIVSMATSFVPHHCHRSHHQSCDNQQVDKTLHKLQAISRRDVTGAFGLATVAAVVFPATTTVANAAGDNVPSKDDLARLKLGHEQVVYLLNNFEQETTGEFF